jgi:uncharacterized membrane protein
MLQIKPDFFIYVGIVGILVGFSFFIFFTFRRIRWLILIMKNKEAKSPKLLVSLRNLTLILVAVAISGMVLFMGFFFRAYQAFTYEKPVAEIITQPSDESDANLITLSQFFFILVID